MSVWRLIGIDDDGARHVCRICDTKDEAEKHLAEAPEKLKRMQAMYADSLIEANEERRLIQKLPKFKKPLYYDFMGWKMQGFFITRFVIEEV